MTVGDLVQVISTAQGGPAGSIFAGFHGMVVLDHSPMRPPDVGRVVDVMWDNGVIQDMYSDDLEVLDETR